MSRQAAHKRFTPGPLPMERFTPRAKQSLEAATVAAKALGHTFVGTEHLLLGLFRASDTVAYQVLVEGGATFEDCRQRVVDLLAGLV